MSHSPSRWPICTHAYRASLWLLPTSLRRKHGEAMVALFEQELHRAAEHGTAQMAWAALLALIDVMQRAVYECVHMPHSQMVPADDFTVPHLAGDMMRPMSSFALLRRIAVPFLSVFGVLTTLLVAQFVLRNQTNASKFALSLLAVPFTAALTIPMAVFVALLWAARSMRTESASPVVPPSMLRAVLIVSTGIAALTLVLTAEIVPRANARLASVLAGHEMPRSDRSMTLRELEAARRAGVASHQANTMTPRDLSVREASYGVEIHKKFAIAAACVMFALAGLTLGWRFPRSGIALLSGMSVAVFGLFYMCLRTAESLAEQLVVSPGIAMWGANLIGLSLVSVTLIFSRRSSPHHPA